jgi:putative pre-16S rRNA nuclease
MRILAIDHGTRRMGVAVSDALKTIALPLEFIPAEPSAGLFERLRVLVREKEVESILVGMPRNMDGSYGPAAEKVREFVTRLEKEVAVRVRLWDERLTSAQANRFLTEAKVRGRRRRDKVDQTAAAILLQSFLDAGGGGF